MGDVFRMGGVKEYLYENMGSIWKGVGVGDKGMGVGCKVEKVVIGELVD